MPQQSRERTLVLIEDITSNADSVQHSVLSQILAQNSNTEYLHGLLPCAASSGDDDDDPFPLQPHTFKRIAPLSCYEDMQPYFQRIADGDMSPILTGRPITLLLRSSGTSCGRQKMYPAIEADSERRNLLYRAVAAIVDRHIEGMDDGKEALFHFTSPRRWTAGGLPTQSFLMSYLEGVEVQKYIKARYTSPIEVMLGCEGVGQSAYCQLLCALLWRHEVVRVGTAFASGLLHVMHVLKDKWMALVEDIRAGSLNEREVVSPRMREAVERQIEGPNPALAMQVEEECHRQPLWQGIIRRLWPRAKCVSCATSGSMEQYIPMLEFFSGGLPLVSTAYAASECVLGLNMNPLCSPYEVSFTFLPNMAYFEFLPLDTANNDGNNKTSAHQSQLVDLVDVKLGQEYEVVVTTFAGLYRYRVGDCLRVTGFHNKTPQFRLIGRKNVVLSIDIDKTDDATLHKAVQAAKTQHLESRSRYQLVDYTSCTDVSTTLGRYVLFWEVRDKVEGAMPELISLDSAVMQACCDTLEECFDLMYKLGRVTSWIGPLEIRVVSKGTFQALLEYSVGVMGASLGQYKTPRVVKLAPLLELLNSRVSHSFFASTGNTCKRVQVKEDIKLV